MKRKQAEFPFENYWMYAPRLHEKEGRYYVILVDKENSNKRKCISFARYLMSVHLGRLLSKEEHVDHIDDDKKNDVIENLQILSQEDNQKKYSKNLSRTYAKLVCSNCKKDYIKEKRHVNKTKTGQYCSRRCAGIGSYQLPENNPERMQKYSDISKLKSLGLSCYKISEILGIPRQTVDHITRKLGINTPK